MTNRLVRPVPSSAMLAATLALCLPRPSARADDSIEYKFENYREEDGRITVETQSGRADQDIGADTHLTLLGTIDAVSGATPTGIPAPPGSAQRSTRSLAQRRREFRRRPEAPRSIFRRYTRAGRHGARTSPSSSRTSTWTSVSRRAAKPTMFPGAGQ